VDGGNTATYVYDGLGNRVEKIVGGADTEYLFDADGRINSVFTNGTFANQFVYLNGRQLAEYSEGTTYFVHSDYLGSTRLLTKLDGSVRECDDYYPYGESIPCGDTSADRLKFTGKERDSENGLDYFGARYYASNMGRWMNPDWAVNPVPVPFAKLENPQTLNLYAYVANNPTSLADRDGHDDCTYDQTGKGTCVKRSFWHNLFVGDTYKLKADSGKTYNLSESLKELKNEQKYQIIGAKKTSQLLDSFLSSQSPKNPGQTLSYSEITKRATDANQWNWKVKLNTEFGAHTLFVLDGAAQRSDYMGNFAFGYLINSWGSSTFAAKWGGAAFNMYDSFRTGVNAFKGSAFTGYDDPRDFDAINAGGARYEAEHEQ
jgi:RHS repeat-associated protein